MDRRRDAVTAELYLDENVNVELAPTLRLRGFDVVTAQAARMLAKPDEEHLEFAVSQGRVLFTHDRDFQAISRTWSAQSRVHHGIFIAGHHDIGELSRWIEDAFAIYPDPANLTLQLPLAS
ncbi:MAG: DUF5615 family PIN-like protein [Chloroflexota bacterium]